MKRTRIAAFSVLLLALALFVPSQAAFKPKQIPKPKAHDLKVASDYRSLTSEGYRLLDDGDFDGAVAAFTRQVELIPEGKYGTYNLACAYGRSGKVREGVEWLEKCVANGWDDPVSLEEDGDLASLKSDSKFPEILEQARENRKEGEKLFASGLPVQNWTQSKITTQDQLDEWLDEQQDILSKNKHIWQETELVAAKLHLEAERLGALMKIHQGDRSYDFRIERVRALAGIRSMWEAWGPLSDAVVQEAELYFKNAASVEASAEANYFAGLARALQYKDGPKDSEEYGKAMKAAKVYFSQVPDGTEYAGAANAYLMAVRLEEAGDNRAALLTEVRDVVRKYREDEKAKRVFSVLYPGDAVRSIWPIPLQANDLDGNLVSLDDYKGKVLLIDFWATWCGPCLREMPNVLATFKKYHERGFDILSISLDYGDRVSADSLAVWTKSHEMNWRHISDGKGWDAALADRYFVDGIPAPFLVGRDGSLVASGEDCFGEKLEAAVENALAMQ